MSKRKSEQLTREIIKDINRTVDELRQKGLIRDECGVAQKKIGANAFEISFSGKTDANTVMLDKHVSASYVMNIILKEHQYTILLYDKSIVQAEFFIDDGKVAKERLIFLKKHNRIWNKEEIFSADSEDEDWFADEESIPTFLRIDYDPSSHIECEHPIAHLTLANNESCRIPIQDAVTFSEFIRFVLFHFYGIKLEKSTYWLDKESTITDLERKMLHINWSK